MLSKNSWSAVPLHNDLLLAKKYIYDVCDFDCTSPTAEDESAEYGAFIFKINRKSIRFRAAKITPTKTGQFVTLWKRIENGPIQPFDAADDIDFAIISVRDGERLGQFVFSKSILCSQGILSENGKGGKRGIRVYPPWDFPTSKQALKTQQWQSDYFLSIQRGTSEDLDRAKRLFR